MESFIVLMYILSSFFRIASWADMCMTVIIVTTLTKRATVTARNFHLMLLLNK
ncbi:hypothetical protein MBAV_004404 [Candidatus Magnetobacterium bavaricum]|uniref:Uncharacterized protein n=1 Tax=Candidatus Magnetobacterium bavaricum TaxID=29290 RepID=A0A0F3GNE2_9BACT|nr:hypothetical protein MBAV_004404 [Candidatus Magnetobacterium bavaricum]